MTEAMAASIVLAGGGRCVHQDLRWVILEPETMLKTYDELPVAQQRVYSVEVFREITLNPAASKLLSRPGIASINSPAIRSIGRIRGGVRIRTRQRRQGIRHPLQSRTG